MMSDEDTRRILIEAVPTALEHRTESSSHSYVPIVGGSQNCLIGRITPRLSLSFLLSARQRQESEIMENLVRH